MRSHRRTPTFASALVAVAVAILAAAGTAAALASRPRAADSFSGHVSTAAGRWHHDSGHLAVQLIPGAGTTTRHLVIRLTGVKCGAHKACVNLRGRLTGTITARPGKPDTGRPFAIKVSGQVTPLGHVRGTGVAVGTGSIARGRVILRLTLTAAHGSVTVAGTSAPVPSFSAP